MGTTVRLLSLKAPDAVVGELEKHFRADIHSLEIIVRRASKGDEVAAREYVTRWRHLAGRLLMLLHREQPDVVTKGHDEEILIVDAKGRPGEATLERLVAVGAVAPCSGWVEQVGLGRGMAVRLLAEVREAVPGAPPLIPRTGLGPRWASGDEMKTAVRLIERALGEQAGQGVLRGASASLLRRVMTLFEVDRTELAQLFGVRRQAVEQWERRGVPAERQAKLATTVAIGEMLARKLRSGLLPGVARRAAPAYQGRTMLEMIAQDDHDRLLETLRRSFDWATTA